MTGRRRVRQRLATLPPPVALTLLYLVFIALGAGLLMLPVAHHGGVGPAEALFTSVSAVTVTGLVVAETGPAFTGFGQAVILFLIQLGGLGLMTFAVLVLAVLGIPVGLPQRLILHAELNATGFANLGAIARMVLRVGLSAQALGAAVLTLVFVPQLGWSDGLWHAVFLSVSAFNNAGLMLTPDSLTGWAGNATVILTVSALVITGGLGFVVLSDLHRARRWAGLTLHSKLMLAGTAALCLIAWALFAALEWTNPATLGGLDGAPARLLAAWFQGVTPRTAGFNSIDTAGMHDATSVLTMALMTVGGGSSSTAGGIKVTTVLVLILATLAFFRRQPEIHVFGRSLRAEELAKVMALTTVSVGLILLALFLAAISHDGPFLPLAFEIVSAFGTVGLSLGATEDLDGLGRAVVMAMMVLGRVGPLTLGFVLATRAVPRVRYPKGQVYIG